MILKQCTFNIRSDSSKMLHNYQFRHANFKESDNIINAEIFFYVNNTKVKMLIQTIKRINSMKKMQQSKSNQFINETINH